MELRPGRPRRLAGRDSKSARLRIAALGCVLGLGLVTTADAASWEAVAGELGRTAHRFAVHFGGSYGAPAGSEVPRTEAGPGFEVAGSYRAWRSVSLYGGFAWHSSSVTGQVTRLLDTPVRPDRRSGTVDGNVRYGRLRGGVRVDAYRMEDWKFQIYLLGGVLWTSVEAKLDTIDGQPPQPYMDPGGRLVDPGNITSNVPGFFGRVGADYALTSRFAVDLSFTFETVDPPPGTNDLASVALGGVFRF